ncbi:MAG: bifunctional phosphoribosyl-AMP cyclohydrolase/phosphoribosyl-ATP diphosphatase HisIE [Lachnospiraceae bacterium]|nr:bifunctional phosphoribosyl-AMP cyclohydrolase/phosphoribosyl-ATP diphosphatase HisIE [Lachnospiraceae bacterium]
MSSISYPCVFLRNEKLIRDFNDDSVISENPVDYLINLQGKGAKKIVIFDLSENDNEHDRALTCIRSITRKIDVPVIGAGNIKRLEDVKKIIYAGCKACALNMSKESNIALIEEAAKRFDKDKIIVCIGEDLEYTKNKELISQYTSGIISINSSICVETDDVPFNVVEKDPEKQNYKVEIDCKYKWSDLKLNSDGMIPVVVQDYKNDEVLMVAYMNEEAFNKTIETGIMTYFSRSRNELWVKGLTSGHFQYVKSMSLDCDLDTILVKVLQIGSACHTGKGSCFFNEAFKLNSSNHNPSKVFDEVMETILDRKKNPKEGSYTNYLFDKGIDKVLKKVGEEATEIVIAAKNPDKEEIKYEIADFLYHVMVLMAQKDVTWEDITEELANR